MCLLLAQALSARVPWPQPVEPAGVRRILSVPTELSSAERLRAGGADLAGGTRSCDCQYGQKGGICHVF